MTDRQDIAVEETPAPAVGRRRARRSWPARVVHWTLLGVAVVVVLAGGALVGGLLWLRTSWGHEVVRDQIVQRLGAAITGEVRLGRMEGDVLNGVTLHDFALIGEDGVPLIAAERIQVQYALRPFFDKRIAVDRVRLVRPDINLIRRADGRWNFQTLLKPRPPRPPDPTPGWGSWIRIGSIEFVEGSVRVAQAEGGWPVLDWSENQFVDLNGSLELDLYTRDQTLRRFTARDLEFRTTAPELAVERLDGTGIWTPDSLVLRSIAFETPGTEMRADGQLTLGERDSFALTIDAPRVSLDEARRFFPAVRLGGNARFEGRLAGPATEPTLVIDDARIDTGRSQAAVTGILRDLGGGLRLELDARVEPVDPSDVRLFVDAYPVAQPLSGTVRIEGPVRQLAVGADLRAPSGAFTVDGQLDLTAGPIGYDLTLTSRELDVGALIGRPPIDLVLTGTYLIEGRGTGANELDARIDAQLDRSQIYRWDVLAAETRGVLRGRTFLADTLVVRLPQTVAEGTGVFGLARDGQIETRVALLSEDLEEVWPGLGDVSGRARGTAELSGTYRGFDATGDIVAGDLDLRGVRADSFAGRVTVNEIGGPMRMTAVGTFHQLAVAGIRADTAAVHLDYADDRLAFDGLLDHTGEAVTTLGGGVDLAGPTAIVQLDSFAYRSPEAAWTMTEGSGLTVAEGVVRFAEFRLTQNGQTIRADGVFSIAGASNLTVEAEAVELVEVARILGQPTGDWQGQADVRAQLEGPRRNPRITLEGQVSEGMIRGFRFVSINGAVDYANQTAQIDGTITTPAADHDILMNGRIPLDLALVGGIDRLPNRPVDLHIEGRGTDLSLLGAFVPQLTELSGPIDLQVDITGTAEAPRFEGFANLIDGRMTIPETGMTYEGIRGRIGLTNDRITVEELVGSDGARGTFQIRGGIEMQNLQLGELDLSLEAIELQVVDLRQQDIQVNGALALSGTTRNPILTGQLSVDEAIYRLPERSEKEIIDLDRAVLYVEIAGATPPPVERSQSVWDRTRIELDIVVTDDAVLTASNARIEIAGDLALFKPAGTQTPTFSGTLDVQRGYYEEFGRRFTIEEGEVFFFGTPELNPGLHIVATQTLEGVEGVGEVNVRITLGGTLRNPTIDLSSTPAFDKSEIIALALFGTPNPSASQQSKFNDTVQGLFAGQATAQLQAALSNELGLDLLEITQRADRSGETARLFRVGKFISPDFFLTYEGETGGDEDNQAIGLRYNITDLFTVQVSAGTRETGVDLFWEFTY